MKTPQKTPSQNEPQKSRSKRLFSESDTQVPPEVRKSLKSKRMALERGVNPPSSSHIGVSFFSFVSVWVVVGEHVRSVGSYLTAPSFVLFMVVSSFGGVGVSGRRLWALLASLGGAGSYRAFNNRLLTVIGWGLVVRSRARGNGYTYRLSVVGERLVVKAIGREALRATAMLVKESIK